MGRRKAAIPLVPQVSLGDLQRALVTLEGPVFVIGASKILGLTAKWSTVMVGEVEQLTMALYEWLRHLDFLESSHAQDLAKRALFGLKTMVEGDEPRGPCLFVIAEQRYATWVTRTNWYDYIYGQEIRELPEPAITTISCDLSALRARLQRRLHPPREPAA